MTDTTNGEKIANAVKGEFALGLQRIFVIVGVPLILGIGGFLGVRAVTSVDDIAKKLEAIHITLSDQSAAIAVLQNTMTLRGAARDDQIRELKTTAADHENRIRVLERPSR